jgi:hypothetical protein
LFDKNDGHTEDGAYEFFKLFFNYNAWIVEKARKTNNFEVKLGQYEVIQTYHDLSIIHLI